MDFSKLLPLLTGSIAVLSAAVGLAIYVTKLRCDITQSRTEDELKRLRERYSELETKHRTLLSAGSVVFAQKSEIDAQLSTIADAVEAEGSSILVAAPSISALEKTAELVFLSLGGQGSESLKGLRVKLDTVAGTVFNSGKAIITHDPRKESSFAGEADRVSRTKTREMLALPLLYRGRCVGVAEFLNRRGDKQFDLADQLAAERLISSLAGKVGEFVQDPAHFELLGITPRRDAECAAVLFSDVSGSSVLAKHLDAAVVIDLMNEYFEVLCDVAMGHEGTIDKFLGDGFMVTFNVPKPINRPERAALAAALGMQTSFDELKHKWSSLGIPHLFNRIGVAFGPVHRAEMGHSQYRHMTVMGDVVNTASNLCQVASRDKSIVVIDEELVKRLSPEIAVQEIPARDMKGTKAVGTRAYELASLR
jgi:class 3 adenylate cyclase